MIYYIAYHCIRIIYHPIVPFTYGKPLRNILKSIRINGIRILVRQIKLVFLPRYVRKDYRISNILPFRNQFLHYSTNHSVELSVIAYIKFDFAGLLHHFLYFRFYFRSYAERTVAVSEEATGHLTTSYSKIFVFQRLIKLYSILHHHYNIFQWLCAYNLLII